MTTELSLPKDVVTYDVKIDASVERSYLACLFFHMASIPQGKFPIEGQVPKEHWFKNPESLKRGIATSWRFASHFQITMGMYPIVNQGTYQFSFNQESGTTTVHGNFGILPVDFFSRLTSAFVRRQVRKQTKPPNGFVEGMRMFKGLAEHDIPELVEQFQQFEDQLLNHLGITSQEQAKQKSIGAGFAAMVSGGIIVARADGRLSAAEKDRLLEMIQMVSDSRMPTDELSRKLQLHADVIEKLGNDCFQAIESAGLPIAVKFLALSNIVKVALADGECSHEVHVAFQNVCLRLGLSEVEYENWSRLEMGILNQAVTNGHVDERNVPLLKKLCSCLADSAEIN